MEKLGYLIFGTVAGIAASFVTIGNALVKSIKSR